MRFNYAAQPEDGIAPEDLIPRIGEYDYFAIDWGYRYLPQFKNAYDEQKYLSQWVTEQRKANPRVFFGTETDRLDPRFQAEDLSDNTIAANDLGMKNLKRIMEHIEEWTATVEDDNYSVLKNMYNGVTGQHLRYMFHAAKYIGGRYSNAALRSEGLPRYEPVEKAKQQEAMAWLTKYVFTEQPWLYNCHTSRIASGNIDAFLNKVVGKVMAQVMTSIQYLVQHEALLGDKAYTCQNLMDDLYKAIWKSTETKNRLSSYERMLQNLYVDCATIVISDGPIDVMPELSSLYVGQLEKIGAMAKKRAAATNDPLTKNHLLGITRTINTALTGEKDALVK